MSISDSDLWELINSVMSYSVDSTMNLHLRLGDKPIKPINEEIFLEELYASRDSENVEQLLQNQLTASTNLICVAGGRGCGKTSLIHYVIHKIKQSRKDLFVSLLDIKKLYVQIASGLNKDNAQVKLSELTRRVVQRQAFPSQGDVVELTSWLLAGQSDETDPVDDIHLAQFSDLSHEIASEASVFSGTRRERYERIREFFLTQSRRFGEVWKLVSPTLGAVHVILATIYLRNFRRAVMIYDNVDRLPADLQPFLLMIANDANNAVSHVCTTAIAIRRENIRRPPGEGDGADYINVMYLNDEEYPKVLMPRVGIDHARAVLEKRYEFTSRAIRETGEIEVTDEVSAKVAALHSGILGEFNTASIHALSNESLRNIVSIYIGFVRYLRLLAARLSLDYATFIDPATTEDRHLRTLFFLWLREEGRNHGVTLYEILKTREVDGEVTQFSDLASEYHLLMTCILNLTFSHKDGSRKQYPTVASVFERMKDLGFPSPRVRKALVQMCAAPGEQPKVLELQRTELKPSHLDENSDEFIGLTVLGEELITSVYSAVGYVWGQAYHEEGSQRLKQKSYHEMSIEERIEVLYVYLEKFSGSHLKMLSLLRTLWLPRYGDSWLDRYRKNFGVSKKFLIERIFESAVAFYGRLYNKNPHPFIMLSDSYGKLLGQLRERASFDGLNLQNLSQGRQVIKSFRRSDRSGGA